MASKNKYGISIQEAVDLKLSAQPKAVSQYNSLLKDIRNSGIAPDADLSVLNSEKGYNKLLQYVKKQKRTASSTANTAVYSQALITAGKPSGIASNYFKEEETRLRNLGTPEKGFNRVAQRKKSKLEFPDQKKMHKSFEKSLLKIENPNIKAWATVKLLTGLRNPDISQIELEPEDINQRQEGVKYLSRTNKTVLINNKGNPIFYDLGETVYEVLREQANRAENEGRRTLWPISDDLEKIALGKQSDKLEQEYRSAINKAVNEEFKKDNLIIIDHNKNKSVPFTIKHLRKNIFDALEEIIGKEDANKVLGHKIADVGMDNYKVQRTGRKGTVGKAADFFYKLYLQDIGIVNPKNWLNKLGFTEAAKNVSEVLPDSPFGTELDSLEEKTTKATVFASDTAQDVEEAAQKIDKSVERTEKSIARLEELQQRKEELTQQQQQPRQRAKKIPVLDGKSFKNLMLDAKSIIKKKTNEDLSVKDVFRMTKDGSILVRAAELDEEFKAKLLQYNEEDVINAFSKQIHRPSNKPVTKTVSNAFRKSLKVLGKFALAGAASVLTGGTGVAAMTAHELFGSPVSFLGTTPAGDLPADSDMSNAEIMEYINNNPKEVADDLGYITEAQRRVDISKKIKQNIPSSLAGERFLSFRKRAREKEGIEDITQGSLNTAIEQSEQNSFNILKQEDENERTEGIDNNPDVTSLQKQMSTLLENNPNQPTN
tara:strand:+ start:3649 stop:5787 length:2139 start_codon:yes stop_codon:yes gene_type:complete